MATRSIPQQLTRSAPRPPAPTLPAQLQGRDLTDCDGVGTFTCPIGTCYTGIENGYIGCCSVSSCAARTTCIPYTAGVTQGCNPNTGGCVVCSESVAPACVTILNILEDQFIMYCGTSVEVETLSYMNLVTTGSMADPPGIGIVTSAAAPSGEPYISFISETVSSLVSAASAASVSSSSISSSSPSSPSLSTTTMPTPSTFFTTTSSSTAITIPTSPTPTPNSTNSSLSKGTIVGIAIGILSLILCLSPAAFYCIRLLLAHRNRKRHPTHTPRGTLGGATLPGGTPLSDSIWKPDSPEIGSNPTAQEHTPMLRSNPENSAPWSPNSVGLSNLVGVESQELESKPMKDPELDGRALTPPLGVAPTYRGDSTPTIRHVLEAEQEANVRARELSGEQGGTGLLPLTPAQGKRESGVVSELGSATPTGSGQVSPMTTGSGTSEGSPPGTGTMTRISPLAGRIMNASAGLGAGLGVNFSPGTPETRMSATGSWKGYMSPEEALAGGWKDDGEGHE